MKSVFIRAAALLCALLLCVNMPLHCLASEIAEVEYSNLFQKAKDAGDNLAEITPSLSEAFLNDPIGFLQALALEEMSVWDTVGRAIADYNTGSNELEFLQFLLEIMASEELYASERNALLMIFMPFYTDVSAADDEFLNSLINALKYADGMGADKCGHYLYVLFLSDPVRVLDRIMEQDAAFQEQMVITLDYQSWEKDAEYVGTLRSLADNPELSEAEKEFVARLIALIPSTEPTDAVSNTETAQPTDETVVTVPKDVDLPEASNDAHGLPVLFIALISILLLAATVIILKKRENK